MNQENKIMLENIIKDFSTDKFIRFFRDKSRSFVEHNEPAAQYNDENFTESVKIGEIKSVFVECGINPKLPIRKQEPNPLLDRKELDDIVFDVLELTKDERKEVYWSVCELVQSRLSKAKSV